MQPSLQVIPLAPQLSRPGTPQSLPVILPNVAYGNVQHTPVDLAIPPPIPQHSRPGTPQPAISDQDQKYNYAPISVPPPYSSSYQPASHQQQSAAPQPSIQPQLSSASLQGQLENHLVTTASQTRNSGPQTYPPEKTAAYTSNPQIGASGPSSCPTPLPQYSAPQQASAPQK
jgi:hypothetical protein